MSSSLTNSSDTKERRKPASSVQTTQNNASPLNKGKSKANDHNMEEEEEEEEDEEDEEIGSGDEEESDEEAQEDFEAIDPSAIIPQGRRTRGVRVDYTSKEALAKAGLESKEEEEDSDDDVVMKE